VIRRVATLLAAGLLLCACGSVTPGVAMAGWVKQSGFNANARSLFQDAKNSAKDLRNLKLTSNDLRTLCSVLFVDDGSMQSSLPSPDRQATTLLNHADDRAKALASLSSGAALFSEARARVAAAS
jgi:hypothetical protein